MYQIVIKIFGVYYNKSFCCTKLLPQILLQHLVSTIAMIFFIAINIFSCNVYISFFDFLNQKKKKKNQVPFLLMAVDILMQIYAQDILNERLEALKLKKFPNLHQSKNIALLDFDFASFHQPLANDDVIGFIDMLEHMSPPPIYSYLDKLNFFFITH